MSIKVFLLSALFLVSPQQLMAKTNKIVLRAQAKAQVLYKKKQYKKHIAALEKHSAELNESNLYQLASSYYKLEKYPKAINHLQELIAQNPNKFIYHYYLGLAHARWAPTLPQPKYGTESPRKKSEDLAVAHLRKSTQLKKSFLPAYKALAQAFIDIKNNYELHKVYLDMVNQFGLSPSLAHKLCKLSSEQGSVTDALAYCEKAINLNPKQSSNYAYLATSLQDQGEKEAAKKLLFKALKKFPHSPEVNGTLGKTLHSEKSYSKAIYYLKRTLKKSSKDHNIYLALADSLFELKKYPQALKPLLKACQLNTSVNIPKIKVYVSKLKRNNHTKWASAFKALIPKCYKK